MHVNIDCPSKFLRSLSQVFPYLYLLLFLPLPPFIGKITKHISHFYSHLMAFQCFVCDKYFSRAQDRSSHIRLKKDDGHKQYLQQQQQHIIHQFSATVEAATTAAANNSPNLPPILNDVSVRWNDVDTDDLPSPWNMDIDTAESDLYSDDEHSIISCPEVPILDDDDHNHIEETMAAASYALGGIDLDNIPEAFDFLPDPDLDVPEGESSATPSTAEARGARRTLVDLDAEEPTYKWHQTAGQVYGQEPTNYARWQSLFNLGPEIHAYEPFKSRLDWEVAQWAVKEKISQKSFNRLLNIPQVGALQAEQKIQLMVILGKGTTRPVFYECPIHAENCRFNT